VIIHRKSYRRLEAWKKTQGRKPLLIRGARQVGKTTLVRTFAKTFNSYIELNLEIEADRNLFETDDVNKIFAAACLIRNVVPDKHSVLLFIDEIRECLIKS